MTFKVADINRLPKALLLLADPSETNIQNYPPDSTAFVAQEKDQTIGVCVVDKNKLPVEILNIALKPEFQNKGLGKRFLKFILASLEDNGIRQIVVGTGNSSLSQLGFYQKCGFRVTGVIPDYFIGYSPPIVENGIRCLERIQLVYTKGSTENANADHK